MTRDDPYDGLGDFIALTFVLGAAAGAILASAAWWWLR